jgi:putative flippase GtrA
LIRHFFTKQFLLFVAVGGFAAFLNWLSRVVLSHWMPFAAAVVLAYVVGMATAFVLNRVFVFPRSDKPMHRQARDFVMINLVSFPMVLVVAILLEWLFRALGMVTYSKAAAHGVAVAIPALTSFLLYKFFAFRDAAHARS